MPIIAVEREERGEDGRDLNGRFYLDVSYDQRTEAKSLGAVWDREAKKWYVPPESDVAPFQQWFPAGVARPTARVDSKPNLPSTRAGRLARYYRLVLEHLDLDKLAEAEYHLDVGLAETALGQVGPQSGEFGRFCDAALLAHDKSPESFSNTQPAAAGASAAPDTQAAAPRIEEGPVRFMEVFVLLTLPAFANSNKKNVVAALPARMSTRGELHPIDDLLPLMNEAHYEPQVRPRHPILGARADLVPAYENLSWPQQQDWTEAWSLFSGLFASVTVDGSTPEQFRYEDRKLGVRIVPYECPDSMIRYLRQLYSALWFSSDKQEAALYRSLLEGPWYKPPLDERAVQLLSPRHTGHMSADGLDPSQRTALKHLIATERWRVLAVSGPPGTGKTACLRAVIATELVDATLDERGPRPPIVVASSATNQAVTNIIKSFGEIAAPASEQSVRSRWLDLATSYGWYYASTQKAKRDEAQPFQLLDGPHKWSHAGAATALSDVLQDKRRREELKAQYLRLFVRNFPAVHARTVEQATNHLLDCLRRTARGRNDVQGVPSLPLACNAAAALGDAAAAGPSMEERHRARRKLRRRASRIAFIERRGMDVAAEITYAESRIEELTSHCLALSLPRFPFALPAWLVTLLLWLKSLFQRERRQQLMRALSVDFDLATLTDPTNNLFALADEALARARDGLVVNEGSRGRLARRSAVLRDSDDLWVDTAATMERDLSAIETSLGLFRRIIGTYLSEAQALQWATSVEAGLRGLALPDEPGPFGACALGKALAQGGTAKVQDMVERLERLIDLTVRRRCFDLAARYWEGRWLLEDHDARLPRDRAGLLTGLRRQCMLAPVIVATAYRLPKLFTPDSGEDVVLGLADLLIVDEAGQAPPAVSAGLFALAQRALVVGDVEQLKPIWGIDAAQDRRLMRRAQLGDDFDLLGRQGMLASSGSAMEMALSASAFRDDSGRAVTLTRHYRCRPTIIEFCNRLVYDRTTPLEPTREPDPSPLFPPMAYVECRFNATRSRGSTLNREEADTLISWLVNNRSDIERHHNRKGGVTIVREDPSYRDIGDLVAIITPYSAQREYILKRVRSEFPGGARPASADKPARPTIAQRLIVGTVHALQGAERPLVLFSATSSPNDGKAPFMDANADMLNVAVSRAKETFVLFGHPGLFFSREAMRPFNRAPSAVLGRYLRTHGAAVAEQ